MKRQTAVIFLLLCVAAGEADAQSALPVDRPRGSAGTLVVAPKVISIGNGRALEVEAGTLLVPESRRRETHRVISIPFYRIRSTSAHPATPIFLLAGGPGSSGIDAIESTFDVEVQFYRGIADVVLFDQRGAGHSRPAMECKQRISLPPDEPLVLADLAAAARVASAACRDHWRAAGIDLDAYTTIESAADVEALRVALGYDRMTLIGGSYGSHLALALMRYFPGSIDRVLLHGVEGLDHTWDDPAGRLAAFERHAAAAEASEEFGPRIPPGGLLAALRGVIERLDQQPVRLAVGSGGGADTVVVDGTIVRLVAGYQAGQRNRPYLWPEFILAMHAGDYAIAARAARAYRNFPLDDPMHYMMDCSSGISPARELRYRNGPARSLLGDINWEYAALCETWGAPDLGTNFRAPLVSSIPTVIVHGTWDTSTPIENAREVAATLENGQLVEVITGNHGALYNLYTRWSPIYDLVGGFLRGEEVRFPPEVRLSVDFATPIQNR